MTEPAGLRERSKARRRAQILRTALRLFGEQGYEATTVAQIAEQSEVAPRTVAGYFPAKIDLVTALPAEMAERLVALLREASDCDYVTVIDHWLHGEATLADRELGRLSSAMFDANPGLKALGNAQFGEAFALGQADFATQIGLTDDDPMLVIVSGAIVGIVDGFFTLVGENRWTPELHLRFVRYLRRVHEGASAGA